MIPFEYSGCEAFRWTLGPSVFEALPGLGARLMRWRYGERELLHWPGAVESSADIPALYGGNPILFPFTARCFDQGEPLFWQAPDGMRRPMPMHGLARQGKFGLEQLHERGFTAVFEPGDEARACYPFAYRFAVEYRFGAASLSCRFTLQNQGRTPLPWSPGHHFYFAIPRTGQPLGGHRVCIQARRHGSVGLHTQGRLEAAGPFTAAEPLDNPRLAAAVIHYGLASPRALLAFRPGPKIVLRQRLDGTVNPGLAFVTWSPAPDAPFYCVEPWMGPSNAPEHRVGLGWVPPGGQQAYTVSLRIAGTAP